MKRVEDFNGHNLIFIVGCSRSGTTYLQRLLSGHPKVQTGQESHLFDEFISPLLDNWHRFVKVLNTDPRGFISLPAYLDEAEFMRIVKHFTLQLMHPMLVRLGNDDIFVEKTPEHVFYMHYIHQFFPQAKFLHMLRDARDVVASLLDASRSWGKRWAPDTACKAAQYWCTYVQAWRKHVNMLPASLVYEIRYENLCDYPIDTLQAVNDFLGLKWHQESFEDIVKNNSIAIARQRNGGTAIPLRGLAAKKRGAISIEPDGFIRKGTYGGWKTDLTLVEKFQVWRVARRLMYQVGYIWKFPW